MNANPTYSELFFFPHVGAPSLVLYKVLSPLGCPRGWQFLLLSSFVVSILRLMLDDVVHTLGNMHLMVEEEEDIVIPNDSRVSDIEGCTLSLIGKFLSCKPFNHWAIKDTLRKVWGLDEDL